MMMGRIFVGVVVSFWLATMAALVRLEYFPSPGPLEAVPTEHVLRKLLANPEPANLTIYYESVKIGNCSISVSPDHTGLAGAPSKSGYRVATELKLRASVFGMPTRIRLEGLSLFSEQYEMTQFSLNTRVGDGRINMSGDRASGKVKMTLDLGDGEETREFSFAQIGNGGLANVLGLPQLANLGLASGLGGAGNATASGRTVEPKTRFEMFPVGGGSVQAYLVDYRLDERMWAKIWVSRAGEVLQVDTSFGLKMVDQKLAASTDAEARR